MTQALDRLMTEDGRYYVLNPGQPNEERFRSVTAPLSRWDKDALLMWAALLAARGALDEIAALVASMAVEDCGRTYSRACEFHGWDVQCPECRCKKCEPCMVRWMRDRHVAESNRRKDEGTRVHEVVGHWAATGAWLKPSKDIEPYIGSFKRWVEQIGLTPDDFELLEARVINREFGYAGTLDTAFWIFRDRSQLAADILDRLTKDGEPRLDRALILGDYKSREKADRALYLDQPLQLAGYRYAEMLILRDGTQLPMFAVDACAIVQIRPDETNLELVLAEEPEFDTFLALLQADEWAVERGKEAIGSRTFKYAPSVVKLRAADARKRRKAEAAAKKAAEAAHTAVDDYTCSCGWKVDGFTAPEFAREKLHLAHIDPGREATANGSPVATEPTEGAVVPAPRPPADDDSPAARGARAAAAARRGVSPVLAEMAAANGVPTVKPFGDHIGRVTTTVDLLGGDGLARAMDGTLDDASIPF